MILVDFTSKHLISIVLLVITYLYLAETKSINSTKFSISESTSCQLPNQNYLLYTTGSCFIKYNKLDDNLQIKRDTHHKINLTDCETDDQVFRKFDYFFNNKQLNLIVFNRKKFSLSVGELDLNDTIFRVQSVYQLNSSNVQFVVDRKRKLVYLTNRDSIERINLVDGARSELNVDCRSSPSYLQLNDDKLVWTEYSNQRTCFYEWSSKSNSKQSLGCVKQNVQSFQLIQDTVYFVIQSGSLFRFGKATSSAYDAFDIDHSPNEPNQANTDLSNTDLSNQRAIEPELIYNVATIKKKFATHLFRFQLNIVNERSANLYLSDLKHQALLVVKLNRLDGLNGKITPEIVLSDQPSFFDFKFVNLNNCPESPEDREASKDRNASNDLKDSKDAKTQIKKEIEKSSLNKDDKESKLEKENANQDDPVLTKFKQDEQILNNWTTIQSNQLNKESKEIDLNVNSLANDEYCTILSCNLITNLIVTIGLVLVLIVSALAVYLSTKKRYNTLIQADPDDQSKCFFKRKINNIQFNIQKSIQTI